MNRTEAAAIGTRARRAQLLDVPFAERLAAGTTVSASGCWEWSGYRYGNGYAAMSWQGKQVLLHRLAYEQLVGPIPTGLQIDHLCRVRHCVNPDHLEPVTPQENTRRAMRSACVNGHEFTESNTYMHAGKRYCRTCRRERVRASRGSK